MGMKKKGTSLPGAFFFWKYVFPRNFFSQKRKFESSILENVFFKKTHVSTFWNPMFLQAQNQVVTVVICSFGLDVDRKSKAFTYQPFT